MSGFWLVVLSSWILYSGIYRSGLEESCVPAKIEWAVSSPKKTCNFCTIRAKISISSSRTRELDEDDDDKLLVCPKRITVSEDEDDEPLVRPSSRKEPVKEKREAAAERRTPTPLRRRKGPPVWRDPSATLEQDVPGNSRERSEEGSILGRNPDGEALRNTINKLSDERNIRDLHLKHCHMSTAQFKKRTTHLHIPGKVYHLYQHVVKTCPLCNSTKPRPDRSRVIRLRAEEFGDLIFLDHGSTHIGHKTLGFLIILDGATSLLTAIRSHFQLSWMDGHFPDESDGDLWRYGCPSSTWHAGILSNA